MAIEQDVIEAPENELSEFIAERNRTRKIPLSISILEKTFFREFVLSPPTTVEFEGPEDFRAEEKKNLVRLMSVIAEKQLAGRKWGRSQERSGESECFVGGTGRDSGE
jgi:hypothetical protein